MAALVKQAAEILRRNGTPLLIDQVRYNIFDRHIEDDNLFASLDEVGAGSIAFCPLAQGVLTDKYLHGIPEGSRATKNHFLHEDQITPEIVAKVSRLNEIASSRGQTLAEMALCWALRGDRLTTVLIGASRKEQILDNVKILNKLDFTADELAEIDRL